MMIFQREVKRAQKALWIWIAALGGMSFLIMSVYPQFADNQDQLNELIKLYPEAMLKAFNIDSLGFDTPMGFYAIEGYLFVTLFGSIYAAMLAGGIIVKEESDKTIEFLLSKPVSRGRIVVEKAAAVFVILLFFNGALTLINWAAFSYAGGGVDNGRVFAMISAAPFLLHLTFAAIALFVSAFVRKSRTATAFSLAIVLMCYFLNILQSIAESFRAFKHVSPFYYVDSAYIIEHGSIQPPYTGVMLAIVTGFVTAAYFVYKKKNITV